jgi:BolA protein
MNRKQRIEQVIRETLQPLQLEVTDETHLHSVPAGSQSHYKVLVVSERFEKQSLVKRHRQINELLKAEFANGLHALALHTLTPQEWFDKGGIAPDTPECLGGAKS